MQAQVDTLTLEGHAAIIACLRIFAARGRQLREAREREQKDTSAGNLGRDAADVSKTNGTLSFAGVSTDATQ